MNTLQTDIQKNNNKVINAWCSYDVANSVYNLIMNTVLFPIYYQEVTRNAFHSDIVTILGIKLPGTVLYDYTLAFAYFLIIFISPLLSGIADYGGYRKNFMRFFTTLGASSCFCLYWFTGDNIVLGITLVAMAVVGYAGSLLYYNSFLPIIATPDKHNRISARGFSWGYGGSMILLILNLITIENFNFFGFSSKLEALRFSFLEVGIWWIGVSQIAFFYLKDYPSQRKSKKQLFLQGFRELVNVFHALRKQARTKWFLVAFFCFSMGVQTVVLVSAMFGNKILGITGSKLIIVIIIIQVLGIVGSTLFSMVSVKVSNKFSLLTMLLIWILVCIGAYVISTETQFYFVAAGVGLVMGGIQSQARSTYSRLIPKDSMDTASYFSFYDVTEKMAIVLGMFTFGAIEHYSGNMRLSALTLSIFFLLSFLIISFVKIDIPKEMEQN